MTIHIMIISKDIFLGTLTLIILQAMTVLSHMVQHLSDSDELSFCINIVLSSVVPMLGEQDVDIRAGSASTTR